MKSLLSTKAYALGVSGLLLFGGNVWAENATCSGTVEFGTFGNMEVPLGADCVLESGVTVEGNFFADGARSVTILGATIEGNVIIENTTGIGSFILLGSGAMNERTTIHGNLSVTQNHVMSGIEIGESVFANGPMVNGNVTIKNNTSDLRGMSVRSAVVEGNLDFSKNELFDDTNSGSGSAVMQILCTSVAGNLDVQKNTQRVSLQVVTDCSKVNPAFPLSEIGGNLTVKDNDSGDGVIIPSFNSASGNISVKMNTSSGLAVVANSTDGNLTCEKNDVDPTTAIATQADGASMFGFPFFVVPASVYPLDNNGVLGKDNCLD